MAKKKNVHKVGPLNENKKNIIAALIEEYDIETADDIPDIFMACGNDDFLHDKNVDFYQFLKSLVIFIPKFDILSVLAFGIKIFVFDEWI